MRKYILVEGEPIEAPDLLEWARWFETADRHLCNTEVGEAHVSTVFLGLDHSFGSGPPVLWETMIFGGSHAGAQWRYTSARAAKLHHEQIVEALKAGQEPPEPTA